MRIAAVMACHNRRATTLACLRSLHDQLHDELGGGPPVDVYLLDDGSTDGTSEAVSHEFPAVTLLRGDGSCYWNGGMRLAFAAAQRGDYDHYLWLNDDVRLDPDALRRLLAARRELPEDVRDSAVLTGATRDPDTGRITYGGVARPYRWRPMRFELVEPVAVPRQVETMHGNIVLIPRDVVRVVDNLDPGFRHAMGDFDLGLRARRRGCTVWLAPGSFGTCERDHGPPPRDANLRDHWRHMGGVKGLPPREWARFVRRWGGPLWPVYWLAPYVRRTVRALRSG